MLVKCAEKGECYESRLGLRYKENWREQKLPDVENSHDVEGLACLEVTHTLLW
jgi:hypothetical protein